MESHHGHGGHRHAWPSGQERDGSAAFSNAAGMSLLTTNLLQLGWKRFVGKLPAHAGEDVEDFITKKGNAPIDKLIPVQKDRKFKKLGKAMVRVLTDKMPAIIVDNQGHIINGHHRYDALRLLGVPTAKVAMIGGSLKEIMDLM